jgi:hypothetical protein
MQTPYVGILVNDRLYRSIPLGKTKYEAVQLYAEAGSLLGFKPCFFRIQDFEPRAPFVRAYVLDNNNFVRKLIPAPQIIHNRAIFNGNRTFLKLSSWSKQGIELFNQWNRYGKQQIHNLLEVEPSLRPHLPSSFNATPSNIRLMMKLYDALIFKPNKSSVGLGIMLLERIASGWKLTYPIRIGRINQSWRVCCFKGPKLPSFLKRRLQSKRYIVQQRLPLATFMGRPFDLRVSVQRDISGDWQITGIVAKVAAKNIFVTNVAQGGTVYRLEHILELEYPHLPKEEVFQRIIDFSLKTVRRLDTVLPHMADLGLDVGITVDGFPMFIECNGKDQRYSFREAHLDAEWKATYFNPMAYAKYLLESKKEAGK